MNINEMNKRLEQAVSQGFLFEQDGTILSTAEGYNRAALAVIGAMLLNLGKPAFNTYCDLQRRALSWPMGWILSRINPLAKSARALRRSNRGNDPTTRSMFQDVRAGFIDPLIQEHIKRGGASPSAAQEEAVSAMLLAKIIWDFQFGNEQLAANLRMMGPSPSD